MTHTYQRSCRFLLVSLNIDAILGEVTIRQRRKKLEEMAQGSGLSGTYATTLSRLKAQKGYKSVLGLKVLMWVLYSERPLRAEALCHALGVEIGSADLDPENLPALRTLVASCLGLVTIEASSSTVRLVHFTLQEYLSSNPTLFHSPHSAIAEVCLTYLNFRSIKCLSPTLRLAPSTMPLLKYASVYWWRHAKRGMAENIKILALRLLDRFDEHISAQLLLLHHYYWKVFEEPFYGREAGPTGFTGLHGAAFLGIVEITAAILDMKEWDINAADCTGGTALTWAAIRGHDRVVKMLLERRSINPDQADTGYGRTPLSWAAKKGHNGVVKMLLERKDVNPNQTDTIYGRTPLLWAAEKGHEGVVKMLLERKDVNPDQADTRYGRTPLSWAAEKGHEGVVKMLLAREDVNPDQADTDYGQTPLSWAAEKGHEGVVKMLLEREDVNPDQANIEYSRTPLSWAAGWGREGVVKMLLEREDVNPDKADTRYGRTPLSWAAEAGHGVIVKMLLEQEDVNLDQADTYYGRTPLSWAAEKGHEGVVKMLLERKDVNPNQADIEYGRTPLSWAAEEGHEGVVKMLLEREDVNPNQADTDYGRTPLSWTAEEGHEGVVKMLLEQEDVSPDQPDTQYGRTPLLWAAEKGHEGVVRTLLERKDLGPDQADAKYGRMPLSEVANRSYGETANLELAKPQKNARAAMSDKVNQNPESLALSEGQYGVVRIPLGRGDFGCATADSGVPTSLPSSALHPDESVVEMQSRPHGPSIGIIDQPALLPAAHGEQPGLLLDHRDPVTKSPPDRGLSTESPRWSQPLPIWPLKFCCCLRKTKTHPSSI